MKINPIFIYVVASVVILLWVANFVAGLVIEGYNPDPTIGGAVMLVLGLILTAGIRGGNGGHPKEKDRQGDEVNDDT